MTDTETHTCTCTACQGLAFTCPLGYLDDVPDRDMAAAVHNYAQHAHGSLAQVFARKGIRAA